MKPMSPLAFYLSTDELAIAFRQRYIFVGTSNSPCRFKLFTFYWRHRR